MAKHILQDCKLYLSEFDLSGDMNAMALNYSADMQENTTFGNDTHVSLGGLKSVTMGHEGYFSAGTDEVDEVLFNKMAVANSVVTIGPTNGADGEIAYLMQSTVSEYSPGASVGDMMAFSVSSEANNDGLIRGTIMHTASRTSSGVGVTRQLGAVSADQKVYASLHVISGSGSLDIVVESDDNGSMTSDTNRLTFTNATGKTSEFLSLVGAITDDYWRVSYTVTGTLNFIVAIGIK